MNNVVRWGIRVFSVIVLVLLLIVYQEMLHVQSGLQAGLSTVVFYGFCLYALKKIWNKTEPITKQSEIGRGGFTEMMWACQVGDEGLVKKLISEGNDVDARDDKGATALMYSSSFGHMNCVLALLESNATIDLKTKQGDSAYKYAKYKGHLDIAKTLNERYKKIHNG